MLNDVAFPQALSTLIGPHVSNLVSAGKSPAKVWRVRPERRTPLYVKFARRQAAFEIEQEERALRWLNASGIACARVVLGVREGDGYWLATSEIEGTSLDLASDMSPEQQIVLAAEALSTLHRLEVANCPFDQRFALQIDLARARVKAGLVDQDDFDAERADRSAAELLSDLLIMAPATEDLVVTHGDATFENLIVNDGRFAGFVDCGRLGVADRYRDLALTTRSIEHEFGLEGVEWFFAVYGHPRDQHKIATFRLLDEFF